MITQEINKRRLSRRHPVILVTRVITAIGCDDSGDGNPEERSQPPVGHVHINNNKMVRLGTLNT